MKPWIAPHKGIDFCLDLQEGSVLYAARSTEQTRQLPVQPVSYGHFLAGPGHFTHRTLPQSLYQVFITHAGHGRFLVDGREFSAPPGTIALLDCSRPGSRYEAGGDGWDHEWVNFEGSACAVYHALINPGGFTVYNLRGDSSLPARMREIRDCMQHQDLPSIVHAGALIVQLLDEMYRFSIRSAGSPDPRGNVARAIRCIEENYAQPLTLDQLAQTAYLSKYHFVRVFRKQTGASPCEYLNAVRIHHAQNLLLTTSLTVESIAWRVGFSGSKNMIRQFRSTTGMTPGEYRRSGQLQP